MVIAKQDNKKRGMSGCQSEKTDKPLLVLDMDETLLHLNESMNVIPRPGLGEFLKKIDEHFVICIFTFGERNYALDALRKVGARVFIPEDRVISRESSTVINGHHMKSLQKHICRSCMKKTLAVDDSPWNWVYGLFEGDLDSDSTKKALKGPLVIPISPFVDEETGSKDIMLEKLGEFLIKHKPVVKKGLHASE
eukprot:2356614-Rhodomonas_salina.12